MKNSAMIAVALAIALPLLTIGLLVKTNEPVHLTNAAGTASEQAAKADPSEATVSVAKAAAKPDVAAKCETVSMDKHAQICYSSTKFLVLVDLTAQRVGIYNGEQGKWKLIKGYACSSGALGSQTPTGKFRIQNRGTWFYNKSLGEGAQWWVGFDGDYLLHSLPMDENHKVTCDVLGKPLSHGCVRQSVADAKWVYDNVPQDSTVFIYK